MMCITITHLLTYLLTSVSSYPNYDANGTLCKSRIFLVAKLFLASLCLVRDPNHQSNDRCWRVRKSLIFAKRKYRFISYIRHNVLNSFWKAHSFFHFQTFPQIIYQNTSIKFGLSEKHIKL